jgi:hypothetical protein
MTHEQQMELGRQIDVANRAPQTRDEAVALGVWLRSQPEPKAEKPRAARPEDNTFVCAHDVLSGPALALLIKSVLGEIPGEVAGFEPVLKAARVFQIEAQNRYNMGNCHRLPGAAGFEWQRIALDASHVKTALYNIDLNLGILKDFLAFHVANGTLDKQAA